METPARPVTAPLLTARQRLTSPPKRPVSRSANGLGSAGALNPLHLLGGRQLSPGRSVDSLISLSSEIRTSRICRPERYRKDYLPIYGGLTYEHKQQPLRPRAKYLDFLDREEPDPYIRIQHEHIKRVRDTRRRNRKLKAGSADSLHMMFGASLEIRDEFKQVGGKAHATDLKKKSTSAHDRKQMTYRAARENQMIFEVAANGDFNLNFDEFVRMVDERLPHYTEPRAQRERKLHQWFKALDADGNGQIDAAEFFAFALRESFIRSDLEAGDVGHGSSGSAFSAMFHEGLSGLKADERIDRDAFYKLATQLGFGEAAHVIFDTLLNDTKHKDADREVGDETIAVLTLLTLVQARTEDLKPLLVGWSKHSITHAPATADAQLPPLHRATSGGDVVSDALKNKLEALDTDKDGILDLDEVDIKTMLRDLRQWMLSEGMDAQKLFRALDTSNNMCITETETYVGLDRMGIHGSRELATALFDELDDDGSYRVNFSELNAWLNKRDEGEQWERTRAKRRMGQLTGTAVKRLTRQALAYGLASNHGPSKRQASKAKPGTKPGPGAERYRSGRLEPAAAAAPAPAVHFAKIR